MIIDVLSLAAVLCGCTLMVLMVVRSQNIPPLARYAIIGSVFGLFLTGRYIEVDHSFGGIVFAVGVAVFMMTVAVRHLQAFRSTM